MTESRGNNSKSRNARVMVLRFCMSSNVIDIYMKFREDSLNSFQVIQRTLFCDIPREKSINASYGSCALHVV